MQVWNLLQVARWKHRTQKSRQKSPSGHHRTTLSGYIFATEAYIDNRKKLVKQQYVLHMCPQYGECRPNSGWDRLTSLGYPCKFQLVSRLGSVTARHLLVGVSQILQRWTESATYIRQGDHHVGHWPTYLVELLFLSLTVEVLQGKMCQNSLPSGGGGSVSAKISWGRGRPLTILRPSDHYFRSVCLSVCLCRVVLSRLWSDFDQTRTCHVICLGLVVSPRI